MALPVLAVAAELAARTGRPVGDQRLVAALVDASRRFRSAVSHDVSLVTDELELDGSGSRTILLPAAPIVSVTSLVLVTGEVLVDRVHFQIGKRAGLLRRLGGRVWPDALGFAQLTYTHGYDAVTADEDGALSLLPGDIQGAVLDMAQILMNVTPGVQSKTVLGDTTAFGAAASVGVTQVWTDAVSNYQLHRGDEA